jgi:hypothetical protein
MDRDILESFSSELIDQLLSKKVFSMMLSMPVFEKEDVFEETEIDNDIPPDLTEYTGIVEQRLSTIIYGNGNPLNPSPDS